MNDDLGMRRNKLKFQRNRTKPELIRISVFVNKESDGRP